MIAQVAASVSSSVGGVQPRQTVVDAFAKIRTTLLDEQTSIFLPPQPTGTSQCPICLRNCK
jgi:hypothetical protein